jgi:hypothetical protein
MVERWISKTVPAHFGFFAQILPGRSGRFCFSVSANTPNGGADSSQFSLRWIAKRYQLGYGVPRSAAQDRLVANRPACFKSGVAYVSVDAPEVVRKKP